MTDWTSFSIAPDHTEMEYRKEVFFFTNILRMVMKSLEGNHFSNIELIESQTNHNHEEIVENIDVYKYTAIMDT